MSCLEVEHQSAGFPQQAHGTATAMASKLISASLRGEGVGLKSAKGACDSGSRVLEEERENGFSLE
jgi:hypothetical protein